jgi:hypothetical protein
MSLYESRPDAGHPPEELHNAWLSGEAGKEVFVPYPADRM